MDEIKETFRKYSSVNDDENAQPTLNNTKNGLHKGVGKKLEEKEDIPNYGNDIVIQEKMKILQTTIELQEIIINIFQQKLKLSDIRNKQFMNAISNAVGDVQKAADEAVRKYLENSGEKDIPEFRVIKEILDSLKIEQENDFMVNTEKILEKCQCIFMKYEEIYKDSKILLNNYLKKLEKVLKINESPRDSQLQQHLLFPIFEEKLHSFKRILASSEKAFNEIELLRKNSLKIPEQDIDKAINLVLTKLNMAEYAFSSLKLLAVEVLEIEYVQV